MSEKTQERLLKQAYRIQHDAKARDYDRLSAHCDTLEADNARLAARDAEELARLREALRNAIRIIEQLIPESSARGVSDVVLAQARAALGEE